MSIDQPHPVAPPHIGADAQTARRPQHTRNGERFSHALDRALRAADPASLAQTASSVQGQTASSAMSSTTLRLDMFAALITSEQSMWNTSQGSVSQGSASQGFGGLFGGAPGASSGLFTPPLSSAIDPASPLGALLDTSVIGAGGGSATLASALMNAGAAIPPSGLPAFSASGSALPSWNETGAQQTASSVSPVANESSGQTAASQAAGQPNALRAALQPLIASLAPQYGLNAQLVNALITQESGYNPTATSSAGAMGLMQLMPGTATSLGVGNPYDPVENLRGGMQYLGNLLKEFGGSLPLALAAYNAGPNAVKEYGGIPPYPQTQQYVTDIMSQLSTPPL